MAIVVIFSGWMVVFFLNDVFFLWDGRWLFS